eukprot:scaffold2407_cov57-Cyclotella_meneghiniana.AAC.4
MNEPRSFIKDLPKQHPFSLAFRVKHSTADNMWRLPPKPYRIWHNNNTLLDFLRRHHNNRLRFFK